MANDDTMIINGTVSSVSEVSSPFPATKVTYTTTNGKETSALFGEKFTSKATVDKLEAGNLIKVTLKKNAKGFFNPAHLDLLDELPVKKEFTPAASKGGKAATTSNFKPFDPSGAIRGMLLQKAVDIAIAELQAGNQNALDVKNIVENAKVLNKVRAELEKLDVTVSTSDKKEAKKEEVPFNQSLI